MRGYDESTYGDSFADVYDEWYRNVSRIDATVDRLRAIGGDGPFLELGVGTGRLAIPLAATGAWVTGVDSSEAMLSKLAEKDPSGSVTAVLGDMVDELPVGPFAVVFCTFNTFFNLSDHEAQRACLRNAAAVLTPGGAIVLEFAVFPDDEHAVAGEFVEERRRPDGTLVVSTSTIDPVEHTVTGRFTDDAGHDRPWRIRYVTPRTLAGMAHDAGLVVTDRWEDFGRRPFLATSARQVCVLRRRLNTR